MNDDLFSTMKSLSKAVSDNLQPFLEIQRQLSEMFEPLIEDIQASVSKLNEAVGPILEFSRQIEMIQRAMADVLERLPEGTRQAVVLLGQRGWYISLEMPLSAFSKLANRIQAGNCSGVDEWMNDFYERNLDRVKDDLQKEFPHRSRILGLAFQAHKRGEYELSIPVFLSQADGICYELIGIQLYSRRNGRPRTAGFVEQFAMNSFTAALMEPLRVPLPISASTPDREKEDYPSESLNRHEILHGEVVNYATQTNSYKAISWLHYVATILSRRVSEQETFQ